MHVVDRYDDVIELEHVMTGAMITLTKNQVRHPSPCNMTVLPSILSAFLFFPPVFPPQCDNSKSQVKRLDGAGARAGSEESRVSGRRLGGLALCSQARFQGQTPPEIDVVAGSHVVGCFEDALPTFD